MSSRVGARGKAHRVVTGKEAFVVGGPAITAGFRVPAFLFRCKASRDG